MACAIRPLRHDKMLPGGYIFLSPSPLRIYGHGPKYVLARNCRIGLGGYKLLVGVFFCIIPRSARGHETHTGTCSPRSDATPSEVSALGVVAQCVTLERGRWLCINRARARFLRTSGSFSFVFHWFSFVCVCACGQRVSFRFLLSLEASFQLGSYGVLGICVV